MRAFRFVFSVVVGVAVVLSTATLGAEQPETKKAGAHHGTASPPMTPELKKDLADMYQKMADCLRTDKSLEQCSHDAMKNCPVVEKTGHCPINEGMGAMMGKGMKHPMGGMKGMDMSNMKGSHSKDGGE